MRSPARRTCAALLFCAALASGGVARAQSDDETSERARALFHEGLAFADAGDWDRAVQRFREALDLRVSLPIRYNLAQSLVHMGRLVEARDELAAVLADPTAPEDVRDRAARLRAELEARLGRLTVEVRGEAEGAQVTVDGRPLPPDAIGRPAPADPGVRVARLVRASEELDVQEVDVPAGGAAHVLLQPPASIAIATDERGSPPVVRGGDDAWLWAVIISAVVVVAGGAVLLGWGLTQSAPHPSMGDFAPPILEFD